MVKFMRWGLLVGLFIANTQGAALPKEPKSITAAPSTDTPSATVLLPRIVRTTTTATAESGDEDDDGSNDEEDGGSSIEGKEESSTKTPHRTHRGHTTSTEASESESTNDGSDSSGSGTRSSVEDEDDGATTTSSHRVRTTHTTEATKTYHKSEEFTNHETKSSATHSTTATSMHHKSHETSTNPVSSTQMTSTELVTSSTQVSSPQSSTGPLITPTISSSSVQPSAPATPTMDPRLSNKNCAMPAESTPKGGFQLTKGNWTYQDYCEQFLISQSCRPETDKKQTLIASAMDCPHAGGVRHKTYWVRDGDISKANLQFRATNVGKGASSIATVEGCLLSLGTILNGCAPFGLESSETILWKYGGNITFTEGDNAILYQMITTPDNGDGEYH